MRRINTEELLNKVILSAEEKKGEDITVLDIGKISPIADYMVIISGEVPVHTQAICDSIISELKKENVYPLHVEGYEKGRWIAIDYGDVMVNIFIPEVREYYQLEWLWSDAPKVEIKSANA